MLPAGGQHPARELAHRRFQVCVTADDRIFVIYYFTDFQCNLRNLSGCPGFTWNSTRAFKCVEFFTMFFCSTIISLHVFLNQELTLKYI